MFTKSFRLLITAVVSTFLFLASGGISPVLAANELQEEPWPVIIVDNNIASNTLWESGNVYYLVNDIEVISGKTLTIQGGTIVKFAVPFDPATEPLTGLTVSGKLVISGAGSENHVLFTSGRDDTAGGDSNGDQQQTLPAPGDWDFVRLTSWSDTDPALEYMTIRYSKQGLNFHNTETTLFSPEIRGNLFSENTCGLTLSLEGNGSVAGNIHNNIFTQNKFGFCTNRISGSGQLTPTLTENDFNNNTVLPVYLNGNSFPTYDNNIFIGYLEEGDKLGIGLGGEFNVSGTLTIVDDMPFVFVTPMEVKGAGVTLTVPPGAVFKGFTKNELPDPDDPLPGLKIYNSAGIELQSNAEIPIIFTSYRDDSDGRDTNGDNLGSEPYPGDWAGVHFVDTLTTGEPNFTFQWLSFRYAVNGLLYETKTTAVGARTPIIINNTFIGNLNGLRFKAVPNNVNSRIMPTIQNCTFSDHGIIPADKNVKEPGVPIMLENTVQPTYINNTFTNNLHPAIGITGRWRSDATLVAVYGQGLTPLPYLVHGEVWFGNRDITGGIDTSATFTIPEGTIIKFFVNSYDRNVRSRIVAAAHLVLESTAESDEVVFTSYFDSGYGGNTAGNAANLPLAKDWSDVLIRHPESDISYAVFRYGDKALHVENKNSSTPFDAIISDSIFEYNDTGLYLDIQSNGDITSLISDNIFQHNNLGLGTFAKDTLNSTSKVTGLSKPIFRGNRFIANTTFAIYLNGSATLENYEDSNRITGLTTQDPSIGLGGYFGATSTDPNFKIILPKIYENPEIPKEEEHVPYVVWVRTNFDWNTPTELDGGLVVKFNDDKDLHFFGVLNMLTTPAQENTFTSYRDDTVGGDSNGTPAPNPLPAPGEWKGLYLYNHSSGAFSYSTIQYADQGLVIYQYYHKDFNPTPQPINFEISYNTFQQNKNGLTFNIGSNADITSRITRNVFYSNDYGFHTYTDGGSVSHCGASNPALVNNNFSVHSQFPIYLQGSSNPTYEDNNLWDNTHPAIAVGGIWGRDATWSKVHDITFNQDMPYVVKDTLTQEICPIKVPSITMPEGLIVKFMANQYINAFGYLNLLSVPDNEIVFTSYSDDDFGGDIDANGPPSYIARNAWKTVWLIDYPGKFNEIHDLKVYYSTAGIGLYYDGPENTQTATIIRNVEFAESASAIVSVIGWRKVGDTIYGGEGNINATIRNNLIRDSNYGILTVAHDKATGINNPLLENNTFVNIANYPIFLGGTSEPSFVSLNQIIPNPAEPLQPLSIDGTDGLSSETSGIGELSIDGFDLPGNRAVFENLQPGSHLLDSVSRPQANLTAAPNLYPAIGMAGAWNNTVELAQVEGIPYAVTGGFPLTVTVYNLNYKPADNVTVGTVKPENATLTVPANTVFKFSKDRMILVNGKLNLLSTEEQPVIFTSIKDDSAAGDTNRDGTNTQPAKGDWGEVRLATSNAFHHTMMRYATKGLHIYFNGAINLNNISSVSHGFFTENITGISLSTLDEGDILATIENSTFKRNTIHIQGNPSNIGKRGHLCVLAHQNDLSGMKETQNGIENNNINGVAPVLEDCPRPIAFDATNNYWGDPSGPYHPTLNIIGLGSRVSDRVAFDPWLLEPVFPTTTYSILGRITKDTADGDGLAGVTVMLLGDAEKNTFTDASGYYGFSDLDEGKYLVIPVLTGYLFAPPSLNVTLSGADALSTNFIATLSAADVGVSVNNVEAFRPLSNRKMYCSFTVSLTRALETGGSGSVEYATIDGSAVANEDYIAKNGKLTFVSGGPLSKTVDVELKMGSQSDPEEFFSLVLSNPVDLYLSVSSGTCSIIPPKLIFLPLIVK